jgi:hypothetical protein
MRIGRDGKGSAANEGHVNAASTSRAMGVFICGILSMAVLAVAAPVVLAGVELEP